MHAPCDQLYLFSTLLEGGQFHLLLTAQTQNLVPRIFASYTKPTNTRTYS